MSGHATRHCDTRLSVSAHTPPTHSPWPADRL